MSPRAAVARSRETSTRDAILDAAEGCFAERGFAGVSTRDIAGKAGLKNQASLYHHFRDKRALYAAVLERGIAPVIAVSTRGRRSWRSVSAQTSAGARNGKAAGAGYSVSMSMNVPSAAVGAGSSPPGEQNTTPATRSGWAAT